MGLFAALMGQNQQPQGYTYPGSGSPPMPNTQIAPQGGVPVLPTPPSPGANAGAKAQPMMMPQSMPAGASATPQNGASMFSGLANNPMLMAALQQRMSGNSGGQSGQPLFPNAGQSQSSAQPQATQTGNGVIGPYPQVVPSQYQMGPFTQAQTGSQPLPTPGNPATNSWLQQMIARMQGGGTGQ